MSEPLLSVRDLKVHFKVRDRKAWPWAPAATLKAVDGVSFNLYPGETLGIVGESGCGKSTLARACLNLIPATGGEVVWAGIQPSRLDKTIFGMTTWIRTTDRSYVACTRSQLVSLPHPLQHHTNHFSGQRDLSQIGRAHV